ncbi:MAG TPA: squalene/phytoene synthase family protein [Sphingomonas sp.]|nr:squalene/phytoene synthase family protein [Sphingomonas sp.]
MQVRTENSDEEQRLTDPERKLALVYAPRGHREMLSLVWQLDERLGAIVARAQDPTLGQIRLTWWHDALQSLPGTRQVDPLLVAIADAPAIDPAALLPLVEGWEVLLEPLPLAEEALHAYAEARGVTLFRVAAALLGGDPDRAAGAGRLWALADLAFRISDRTTAERALMLAARQEVGALPRALAVLARLARRDVRRGLDKPRRQGSPARVARALLAGLTGF